MSDTPPTIHRLTNQAKIDRVDAKNHPGRTYAKAMLENTAACLKPGIEYKHQGSFAVHMYKVENQDTYSFVCQMVGLDEIPEGQTDVGLKELRKQLMAQYGRTEKTRGGL